MKNLKNTGFLLLLIFLSFSCGNADTSKNTDEIIDDVNASNEKQPELKRYEIKSGILEYKTTTSGKVMGSVVKGSGTSSLYFKNWGAVELKKEDSKTTTHINVFGQKKTEVSEVHTINKLDNGKSFNVDMKNKIITLRRDPAMEMIKTFGKGDAATTGKKMLEAMGGKIIGKEKFLGYDCDVWEIPGGKQWMYKGIPLKLEMTVMGIKTINEATSAKFNINVSDKYFKLPDYPIKEEEGYLNDDEYKSEQAEMQKNIKRFEKMSFDEWKKTVTAEDAEMKNKSDEELRQIFKMSKEMMKRMKK